MRRGDEEGEGRLNMKGKFEDVKEGIQYISKRWVGGLE